MLPSQIEAGVPRQRTSIHHDSSVHLRVVAEVASMIRHRGGDIEEMTHDAFRASSCEKAVNDLVTRSPTEVRYASKQRAHRSPVGKVTMYHQAQRRLKSHGREESVQVGKCARRTTPESVRNRMSVSSRNTAASMKALNSAISTAATRHEHSLVSHHNDGGPDRCTPRTLPPRRRLWEYCRGLVSAMKLVLLKFYCVVVNTSKPCTKGTFWLRTANMQARRLSCKSTYREPQTTHEDPEKKNVLFSWKDMAVCLFLETIRTGAMRVIHIPVKTQETQRLRIKFVLYCPICAMAVSHLFVAEVKGSEQEAVPSGVFLATTTSFTKTTRTCTRIGVLALPGVWLAFLQICWVRGRVGGKGGGRRRRGRRGLCCLPFRPLPQCAAKSACTWDVAVCCPCAGATYVCSKLYSNDFRWV